jgi:hypothetical protein
VRLVFVGSTRKPETYKTSLRYPNLRGPAHSNQQKHQAIKMMKTPYGGVILSAAKDLLYSFSRRNSRCFFRMRDQHDRYPFSSTC